MARGFNLPQGPNHTNRELGGLRHWHASLKRLRQQGTILLASKQTTPRCEERRVAVDLHKGGVSKSLSKRFIR